MNKTLSAFPWKVWVCVFERFVGILKKLKFSFCMSIIWFGSVVRRFSFLLRIAVFMVS